VPWNHNIAYFSFIEKAAGAKTRGSALDVGSGDGMLADRLAAFIPNVIGLDSDAVQVDAAADRYPSQGLRFELGDVLTTRVAGEPFDFVVCSAAIHHMVLGEALTRLRALTAPGGTLVVVGLARNQTPIDWILSAFAVPVSRIARVRRGWYDHGAPMLDPRESWGEVRRAAKAALPGSRYRRRLYWRYTLVWNRPL
jgi:2-polyprenyl-3-methyl-5-hydroxy-6-metoxy-1,4-benzoquinol methylase